MARGNALEVHSGLPRTPPVPGPTAQQRQPSVCVIDDDASIRESLADLLKSVGVSPRAYASVPEPLDVDTSSIVDCYIVDIRMPGVSGLDFQHHLRKIGILTPVILMSGHADIQMTVQAMKAGTYDFMTKPFREQDMLDAVGAAIAVNRRRLEDELKTRQTWSRFETLSAREREVMTLVTAGLLNKQAAARVNIAIPTVKRHRAQIMKKMEARSFAELVRMAALLQLGPSTRACALKDSGDEPLR
jgi:FixJ family two-component response regulator